MIVVTHYQRLLNYIVPDFVHVLVDGRIVRSGGKEMALELEEKGYSWLEKEPAAARRRRPVTAVAAEKDAYRASFERFAAARAGSEPAWLRERRTAAIARFVEKGLPTPRDEAWRHTPIAPLTRGRFEPADPAAAPSPRGPRGPAAARASAGPTLVLVNGRLSPELSSARDGGGGRRGREPARRCWAREPARLEPLARPRGRRARPGVFADLNTAFAEDGAVVFVAPGAVLKEPLRVAHVSAGDGAAHRLLLAHAGGGRAAGSECRIVETFASPDGSRLPHERGDRGRGRGQRLRRPLQAAARGRAGAPRGDPRRRGSAATRASPTTRCRFGAALSRNDIDVRFEAEGGECVLERPLRGGRARGVADTHSRIDHAQPHCSSRELYKGVLDGQARGVFNGLVMVRPGAQKTDARQMNRNLLLSREALVHSTPAARDPGRRRQVQARLDHRPARPERALLPALPRDRRGGGAGPAHLGLRERPRPRAARSRRCARAVERQLQARLPGAAGLDGGAVVSARRRDAAAASTWRPSAREFPVLRETRPRQAPRLPRHRGQRPEAAGGDRRRARGLRALLLEHPPRRAPALDAATEAYEKARARRCSASWAPRRAARSSSSAAPPRRSTSWPRATAAQHVGAGDEVLITGLEHHSNIVPWQMLCEEKGATLRVAPIDDAGEVDLDGVRAAALAPHPDRGRVPRLERARHGQPGARA